jgi:hypothetical protein
MPIKTVFLSSTARDLAQYRDAAYQAIEGLDGYHCVRMEDFGARASMADEFCREKVAECELFVGIVGHLYGSCPEGSEQSYTESALEQSLPSPISRSASWRRPWDTSDVAPSCAARWGMITKKLSDHENLAE